MNDIIFTNDLTNIWDLIQQDSNSNNHFLYQNQQQQQQQQHENDDQLLLTHNNNVFNNQTSFIDDFINTNNNNIKLNNNNDYDDDNNLLDFNSILDTVNLNNASSSSSSSSSSLSPSSSLSLIPNINNTTTTTTNNNNNNLNTIPTYLSQQSSTVNSPATSFTSNDDKLSSTSSSQLNVQLIDLNNLIIKEESIASSTFNSSSSIDSLIGTNKKLNINGKKRKRKKSENDDLNIQMIDSNIDSISNTLTNQQTTGYCRICGDKASGFHYGISSCEGCKGFFRRSIQKQMNYKCANDGNCIISLANRNKCQHCRFKKCLNMGMSRECVRFSKQTKEQSSSSLITAVQIQSQHNTTNNNIINLKVELLDLILIIAQSHDMHCAFTRRKCEHLKNLNKTNIELNDCFELWIIFSNLISNDISSIVEFAKRIPQFNTLLTEDQIILIKLNIFKIWLCRIAIMFEEVEDQNGYLLFQGGYFLSKQQLSTIFGDELMFKLFEFSKLFNSFKLNDIDIGLYCAYILTNIDNNLNFNDNLNIKLINSINNDLKEAFKLKISQNTNNYENDLFDKLDNLLIDLNEINQKYNLILTKFRQKKLKLPIIFSEIFELPNELTNS